MEASAIEVGLPRNDAFLNAGRGIIGRTVSTKNEPNTSSRFLFWLMRVDSGISEAETVHLEIGDMVAAKDDGDQDITFGTVVEMRSYSDTESFIADFLSHDFGDASLEVPTDVSQVVVVTCDVMRNLSQRTRPVGRSRVFFPSSLGIQYAYGIVDRDGAEIFSGAPIPIGIFKNGDGTRATVSVDEDFLIGPEGAHLNVSGISGLAAKTSAIQFVICSLLTHTSRRIGVVMFNVKSRDLLYIDQANPQARDEDSLAAYRAMDVEPEPFEQARFFAPLDPDSPGNPQTLRTLATEEFSWDLAMIRSDIPSLFDSADWDDRMEGVWIRIREEIEHREIHTYTQMLKWIDQLIGGAGGNQQWVQGHHIATWHKMRSRLLRFPRVYRGLIRSAGPGTDIPWGEMRAGSVYVIDIEKINDRGKRLVFGRAMRAIGNRMEAGVLDLDAVVVFVDELNKFAPSGSVRTPLKHRLIDITARGRSIGLVLFGAEQFASSVEKEIVENSSTYLFGRTESNELRSPTFSSLSDEVKTKLTMLPQGQLLAKFAKFPQPIFVRFPHPPCLPGDRFDGGSST